MENERLITCKDALKSSSPSFLPSFLPQRRLTAQLHLTLSPIFSQLIFSIPLALLSSPTSDSPLSSLQFTIGLLCHLSDPDFRRRARVSERIGTGLLYAVLLVLKQQWVLEFPIIQSSSPSFLPSFLPSSTAPHSSTPSHSLSYLLTAHLLHPTRSPIFTNLRFSSIFSPIHHWPPLSPLGSRLPPPRSCLLSIALFVSHWLRRSLLCD
uniref:Uncharacterized protein n=1 Tax=Brassica oleracea var. oleracea TaxID=109376 RepID=A0A0D3CPJ9_BRAOL